MFDPLDGSSNIEAAVCTGTIFGVLEDGTVDMKNDFIKSGGMREVRMRRRVAMSLRATLINVEIERGDNIDALNPSCSDALVAQR